MKLTLWQLAITIRAVCRREPYGTQLQSTPQQNLWGYPYVDYPIANTYEADPMERTIAVRTVYGVKQLRNTPQQKAMPGNPIAGTYELADGHVAIRGVYGVGPAHSYEAPHSKKLWGYPYVDYPIANTYEADPMADSHNYQSSV